MATRNATGEQTISTSRTAGSILSRRRPVLAIAALLLSTGVFYSAVTVAAARGPDPQVAYGPPTDSVSVMQKAPAEVTVTSSSETVPMTIASSWSMSPLPEDGGVVTSSTEQGPVIESSAIVASPQ